MGHVEAVAVVVVVFFSWVCNKVVWVGVYGCCGVWICHNSINLLLVGLKYQCVLLQVTVMVMDVVLSN